MVVTLAALMLAFVWQCAVAERQQEQIAEAHDQIRAIRQEQIERKWFLQTLIRMEFRHFEERIKELLDGAEERKTGR